MLKPAGYLFEDGVHGYDYDQLYILYVLLLSYWLCSTGIKDP